jgi:hypothetical protein
MKTSTEISQPFGELADCKHEQVYKSRCMKCLRIVITGALSAPGEKAMPEQTETRAAEKRQECGAFKLGALALMFACIAGSVQAQGYDTYAGKSGLVTTVQIEQAQRERESAALFRNMSIADRWDNDSGSIARRWTNATGDNGHGSIAERWNPGNFGSIARRWENK